MSKRAKALLLVACIVALVTFCCPRKVNSRRLPAAEGKNHIGETATAWGKQLMLGIARKVAKERA